MRSSWNTHHNQISSSAKETEERGKDKGTAQSPHDSFDDSEYIEIERYTVTPNLTEARVLERKSDKELLYESIEPELSETERQILESIEGSKTLLLSSVKRLPRSHERKAFIEESISSYLDAREVKIEKDSLRRINYYVLRNFLGYGIIDSLLQDENLEDISCDGLNAPVFVYHKKYQNIRTYISFGTTEQLNSFIVYLSQKTGKQISVSDPILDASTPEGNRINATFGREVSGRGGTFTIRIFRKTPFTPVDLINSGTASPELMAFIWMATEFRKNVVIVGGTGVGKTSTLNALSLFIPSGSKIVSIEDTREINLPHENWVSTVTRSAIGEEKFVQGKGTGEIDMFDLLLISLRQRPDYLIVGEVRGRESYNIFQAMQTGQTTLTTMHADSVKSMITRLENQPINIPRIMMTELDLVVVQVQTRIKDQMVKRIKEVDELVKVEEGTEEITTNKVFEWERQRDKIMFLGHSLTFNNIRKVLSLSEEELMGEFSRRVNLMNYLAVKNINNYREIWDCISKYYSSPLELSDIIRSELKEFESSDDGNKSR